MNLNYLKTIKNTCTIPKIYKEPNSAKLSQTSKGILEYNRSWFTNIDATSVQKWSFADMNQQGVGLLKIFFIRLQSQFAK